MNLVLVAIGGFFGSILRYTISVKANKHVFGTWIANITGSILLGILVRFHISEQLADWTFMLLGVGFCGAFTTFSTFGHEVLQLLLDRKFKRAFIYVAVTLIVSFVIVYGIVIGVI